MNKKETAEIKKNFSDKSGFFIMERVLTAFIDAEKNLRYHNVSSCLTMPVEEHDVYDETLKKVLNTNVGKAFVEYEFPNEAYDEGQPQNILYTLLTSELKDETACEDFLNHISVFEAELALMKAVGAKNGQITRLVMAEIILTSIAGAAAGYFMGYAFAQVIGQTVFSSAIEMSGMVAFLVTVLVIAVTLVGSIPAIRMILRLRPSEVLHGGH